MADNNTKGMIEAIQLWGRVCGKQANCESCPIASVRETGLTCQDFAKNYPAKMLSLLLELDRGELTYFQEYCLRFPDCNLSVEDLSECTCRKAVFEGKLGCESGDCVACWNSRYFGDVSGE